MNENVTWRAHPHCPRPHACWSAPDDQGAEHEVTRFVASLVRLTKPESVIETGTHLGVTTAAIAAALRRNGFGHATSFEIDAARAANAERALAHYASVLTIVPSECVSGNLPSVIDFAFLDSSMGARAREMRLVWPRLSPGGLVLVHDASPQRPPGRVRPPEPFAFFEFATPRGLNAFQKPWAS